MMWEGWCVMWEGLHVTCEGWCVMWEGLHVVWEG